MTSRSQIPFIDAKKVIWGEHESISDKKTKGRVSSGEKQDQIIQSN